MSLQVREYGLEVVCAYMGHIQSCAEVAVREMLRYNIPCFMMVFTVHHTNP